MFNIIRIVSEVLVLPIEEESIKNDSGEPFLAVYELAVENP